MNSVLIISLLLAIACLQEIEAQECWDLCYGYRTSCSSFWWSRRCSNVRYSKKCYKPCPVNCEWNDFEEWNCQKCSADCGGGTMKCERVRTKKVVEAHGGTCSGSTKEEKTENCNRHHCPINCEWNDFEEWNCQKCSADCGGGTMKCERVRTKKVVEAHGGTCSGSTKEEKKENCNTHHCPIHCEWNPFQRDGSCMDCSVTCDEGTRQCLWKRTKRVVEKYGGTCTGEPTEYRSESCPFIHCPINCEWNPFQRDGSCKECSVTCDEGTRQCLWKRTKSVVEQYGGTCTGGPTEYRAERCPFIHCPIDGGWSAWSLFTDYTPCTSDCWKHRHQTRTCTEPPPQYGGKDCEGPARNDEKERCYEGDCLATVCKNNSPRQHNQLPDLCYSFVHCSSSLDKTKVIKCPNNTVWMDPLETCVYESNNVPKGTFESCEKQCIHGEFVPNDKDCSVYHLCNHGQLLTMPCPIGTHFDLEVGICNTKGEKSCMVPDEIKAPEPGEEIDDMYSMDCSKNEPGHFPVENECTKYAMCLHGSRLEMPCPGGTYFDIDTMVCAIGNENDCTAQRKLL